MRGCLRSSKLERDCGTTVRPQYPWRFGNLASLSRRSLLACPAVARDVGWFVCHCRAADSEGRNLANQPATPASDLLAGGELACRSSNSGSVLLALNPLSRHRPPARIRLAAQAAGECRWAVPTVCCATVAHLSWHARQCHTRRGGARGGKMDGSGHSESQGASDADYACQSQGGHLATL